MRHSESDTQESEPKRDTVKVEDVTDDSDTESDQEEFKEFEREKILSHRVSTDGIERILHKMARQ